jgi:peptide/nickel transport system substrate-binding protein
VNATRFTFRLRGGVTFSDGTPLTPEVVKANFDDLAANRAKVNPAVVAMLTGYAATEVLDPSTVVVSFDRPAAPFLQKTSEPGLGMLAPATLALPFDQRVDKVVGTGPFVLDAYRQNREVVLLKRKGYTWAPSTRHGGDARIDRIEFRVVPEGSVRTGTLRSGQVKVVGDLPPQDVTAVRGAGLSIVTRANPGYVYGLIPVSARSPLDDVNVRRAIARAIDPAKVRDNVLSPEFAAATGVLSKTTPGYADLSAQIVTDRKETATLLDNAGWVLGGDGIRSKDGRKLSLVVAWLNDTTSNQAMLELLKAQLAQVGVDLRLEQQTGAQIVDGLAKVKYDFFWSSGTQADGDILRSSFGGAEPNYYKIEQPRLAELLERQAAVADPEARNRVLAEAQREILDQVVFIPVYQQTTLVATAKSVHGLTLGANSRVPQLSDVWLS